MTESAIDGPSQTTLTDKGATFEVRFRRDGLFMVATLMAPEGHPGGNIEIGRILAICMKDSEEIRRQFESLIKAGVDNLMSGFFKVMDIQTKDTGRWIDKASH
jgi:hypothetical protein